MTVEQKPVIYQLVVRYFGNTNLTNQTDGRIDVNGCGKFADIDAVALKSLRDLGVTHVWLTGVLRQSTLTAYDDLGLPADNPTIVKGLAGSFYAVRDYFDVCPDYAVDPGNRIQEFEQLVGRIHEAGMKVLIDLVPNHVARSYHSVVRPELEFGAHDDQSVFFSPRNHFYYLVDPPGQRLHLPTPDWHPEGVVFGDVFGPEDGTPGHTPKASGDAITQYPPVTSWYEVIKLDYGYNPADNTGHYDPIPPTWEVVDAILAYWQSKGVDGFRCDMAHLVPAEAWRYLIGRARSPERDPRAYFLAEAYPGFNANEPVQNRDQLIDAGFDALYHADAFHCLREVYKGWKGPDDYHNIMNALSDRERIASAQYLENHDEVRVAAAVEDNGCGSMEANYHVAPLSFLYSSGPLLMLNGQEVGEPGGQGNEGFHRTRGRTTFFDYWCMPEFAKWVNGHAYDGGGLTADQKDLRRYIGDLFALCQDPSVRGDSYWGLRYYNNHSRFADCPDDLYTFARFERGSGRLLLIASNFNAGDRSGAVRLPQELIDAAGLAHDVRVRLVLDHRGKRDDLVAETDTRALSITGIHVTFPQRLTYVYAIG
jgi:glycosidase